MGPGHETEASLSSATTDETQAALSSTAQDTQQAALEATGAAQAGSDAQDKAPQAHKRPLRWLMQAASEAADAAQAVSEVADAAQAMIEARQARTLLEHKLLSAIVPYLPSPQKPAFWLFGVDVTSQPRQFARTLEDRGFVYHPNAIKGNKPVTIGHEYSLLAYFPEKKEAATSPWIVPLSTRRVATEQDKELVGIEQLELLMNDKDFPFQNQLSALVGDTSYSKRAFLAAGSNRTFYQKYKWLFSPLWWSTMYLLGERAICAAIGIRKQGLSLFFI